MQTPENQLRDLRVFCEGQKGWVIDREYVDRMSGGRSDRPEFLAMYEAAGRREFDLVLFWALDRFSREGTFATLQHLQRLSGYGVEWRSYQEPYLDSCGAFKDVVVSLMATMAKQERIRISERTKAGLARAKDEGKILGRPRIDVKPWELRQMQKEGMSLRKIAAETGLSYGVVSRSLAA